MTDDAPVYPSVSLYTLFLWTREKRKGKRKSFCLPSLCSDHSFFGNGLWFLNSVLSWPVLLLTPTTLISPVWLHLDISLLKKTTSWCFFVQSLSHQTQLYSFSVFAFLLFFSISGLVLNQFMLNSLVSTQAKKHSINKTLAGDSDSPLNPPCFSRSIQPGKARSGKIQALSPPIITPSHCFFSSHDWADCLFFHTLLHLLISMWSTVQV